MPKYLVHCDSGFCGVNETVIVNANDEGEAEEIANDWWMELIEPSTKVEREMVENDDDENQYPEIN